MKGKHTELGSRKISVRKFICDQVPVLNYWYNEEGMYSLRLVKKDDLETLSKIFSDSFTNISPDKPWEQKYALEYLKYWFEKQPDMFLCACDDNDNLVGAIATNIKPWRTGMRCTDGVVFVDINFQKRGIATLLLKEIISKAKDKYGVEIFEAITFSEKEFPLTWYEKIGLSVDKGLRIRETVSENRT